MKIKETISKLYNLNEYEMIRVESHEGRLNFVYICKYINEPKYAIRVSMIGDRTENEYLAEVEYVHFLAKGGASVVDVIPSVNGKLVEKIILENREIFISCFEYAELKEAIAGRLKLFEQLSETTEEYDYEDIEDAAERLIHNIPWAGVFEN